MCMCIYTYAYAYAYAYYNKSIELAGNKLYKDRLRRLTRLI